MPASGYVIVSGTPCSHSGQAPASYVGRSSFRHAKAAAPKSTFPPLRSITTPTPTGSPPRRAHRVQHVADAAAGRQHVVDDEHALARRDREAALEGAAAALGLLGEDAAQAQVPRDFVADEQAAGRRPGARAAGRSGFAQSAIIPQSASVCGGRSSRRNFST